MNDEWVRWISNFRKIPHEAVQRAAVSASAFTQDDIDGYYREQASVDRVDALESPKKWPRIADTHNTLRMQKRQDGIQEDVTGANPESIHVDRLVGPGTISSQLSGNIEDRLVHQECDISEILMKHRRSRIKKKTQFERSDLLILNFVVTRKPLLTLVTVASVNAVFPPHVPVVLDPTDQDFVARFCAQASTASATMFLIR
ncbi:hypothetical protein B0O80DRAFT_507976 [Mortierella sp. GBAus27b]|nr:hypothetical protein B0O80DRAFT_507976 [Mortierella sp. GBAus27b]